MPALPEAPQPEDEHKCHITGATGWPFNEDSDSALMYCEVCHRICHEEVVAQFRGSRRKKDIPENRIWVCAQCYREGKAPKARKKRST